MRELSATEVARRLTEILDAVEHRGERFLIRRRGNAVARIEPAPRATVETLKDLLRRHRPDKAWARELRELRASLPVQEREWHD